MKQLDISADIRRKILTQYLFIEPLQLVPLTQNCSVPSLRRPLNFPRIDAVQLERLFPSLSPAPNEYANVDVSAVRPRESNFTKYV